MDSMVKAVFTIINDDEKARSEEHTSELQSRRNRVCRLLLEKNNDRTCALLPFVLT